MEFHLHIHIHTEWNETEGATLLREMRVYVRPRRRSGEETQEPPAVQRNDRSADSQKL
ncbi:hypothetical protein [Peribacillus muralis]|uniref:hypothetical protein n=1 Tax=Peribacillus muralis TaxID=264697 RepID=UPI00366B8966